MAVPRDLSPYDLLIKVAVASNCHTDLLVLQGMFKPTLPCTASHEGSGTVVAVGADVKEFAVGDRVMCGLPYKPCGICMDCLGPEAQRHYCANVEGHCGVLMDGFFADYAITDSRSSTPIPDEVTFESAAPLACAGRTIWRGVTLANLKKGEWIALVGSGGGLGHLGIQFAKALGLNVVGIDARDDGLTLSKETGADVVLDARKGKEYLVKEVQKVTGGQGVDCAVIISDAQNAAAIACSVTKMHGTAVQIAQPAEVSIPFAEFIFRDIRVKGSLLCSPEESKAMLRVVAEHGIKVKTNPFYGLDKITELVELVHKGTIQGKAIIIVDEEQIKKEKEIGAKY